MTLNPEIVGQRSPTRATTTSSRACAATSRCASTRRTPGRSRCYDDVRAVSRDPERFCSGKGVLMNDPLRHGEKIEGSVLHMDPPEHAPWRGS